MKVGLIDYEAGNTSSVSKALEYLGVDVILSNNPIDLKNCDRIVFPGVGAFYDAMCKLEKYGLISVIHELVDSGVPFLGICLGMQLLFDESAETIGSADGTTSVKGLSILHGRIKRFDDKLLSKANLKIPQIGWNSIDIKKKDSKLYRGIDDGAYVYFVHSYHLECKNKEDVASTTEYGTVFDSSVEHGNIFGCQFHPEKSGEIGLRILSNFIKYSD
ncbi:MAG: imidazole glycerol phosphate synthase subunit HisH [Lachnospiraceae bacterium]|nr:imidazole glycerol phosphate synthase subunit HisH [Lachnospiraceae bacterium]